MKDLGYYYIVLCLCHFYGMVYYLVLCFDLFCIVLFSYNLICCRAFFTDMIGWSFCNFEGSFSQWCSLFLFRKMAFGIHVPNHSSSPMTLQALEAQHGMGYSLGPSFSSEPREFGPRTALGLVNRRVKWEKQWRVLPDSYSWGGLK